MEKEYYLIDLERSIGSGVVHYWKAHKSGYTTDLNEAGVYSDLTAGEIVDGDFDRLTVKVEQKKAEELAGMNQKKKYSLDELLKDCTPENRHEEISFEKSDEDGFTMTIQDKNGLFDKLERETLRKKLLDKSIQDNYEALKKMED